MGWLILLLLVSPVFYASYRSYSNAGGTSQPSLGGFATAMCFAAALAILVVILASSADVEGDDLLGLLG